MKILGFIHSVTLMICLALVVPAGAEDKATLKEVYDLVLSSIEVIQNLGDESLSAFNDPKGEFVFKDTYVYVMDCKTGVLKATPDHPEYIGQNILGMADPNGVLLIKELCEVSNHPMGGWTEYLWSPDGASKPTRKVCYGIKIPQSPYTVMAGIHSDEMSIEELNKIRE